MDRWLKIVRGKQELLKIRVYAMDIKVFGGITEISQYGSIEVRLMDDEEYDILVTPKRVRVDVYRKEE